MKKYFLFLFLFPLFFFSNTAAGQVFDLALRKTNAVGNFAPDGDVTFTFKIYNQGTVDATNIVISDYIPNGLTLNDADWTLTGSEATTTIPSLSAGQDTTVTITFDIDPTYQQSTIQNLGEISAAENTLGLPDIDSTPDMDPHNDIVIDDIIDNTDGDEDDHDEETIMITQIFDLALRKTTTTIDCVPGGKVTYLFEVYNQGTVDATNIVISDYIPNGLILNDTYWTLTGSKATRTIPSLGARQSTTMTITFDIAINPQQFVIQNLGEISAAENALGLPDIDNTMDMDPYNDPVVDDIIDNTGGDEDDHDVGTIIITPIFDLSLRKTNATGNFVPGGDVTFTFEIYNQGTVDATNIVISDYIPNGLILNDANWTLTGSKATRTIPSLGAGQDTTVTITFDIATSFQQLIIQNLGEISAAENTLGLPDIDSTPDMDPQNDIVVNNIIDNTNGDEDDHDEETIMITQTFDLALRKTNATGNFVPGGDVTFTFEIYNQGTVDATNIVISDYVPNGLILNDTNWTLTGSKATTTIASLGAGQVTTVTITFDIATSFQQLIIQNLGEISAAENTLGLPDIDSTPDMDPFNDIVVNDIIDNTDGDEDDHDEETIMITQTFDLALRKIGATGNFVPDGDVTFIFEIYNQGTVDATNIVISDYVPNGLTLNDTNWTASGNKATTTIASLGAGQNTVISITFDIDPSYQQLKIQNIGEISAAENILGLPDIDSTPDMDPYNDIVVNDIIDNTDGDEDDHDEETIMITQTFDLALRKTGATGNFLEDGNVTFFFEVFNQGTVDATNIVIMDYIPEGLILNDSNWTLTDNTATTTIASLSAGHDTTITITFDIHTVYPLAIIQNIGEIGNANNPLGLEDVDSTPDTNSSNDIMINDVIDNTGGDEDDHDAETITITYPETFDLALRKTEAIGYLVPGGDVTFTFEIYNQGTVDATNIVISDYIPNGLILNDTNWTLTGSKATTTIASLGAGQVTTVTITFDIDPTYQQLKIQNLGEISATENILGLPDIDSTPDMDPYNDIVVNDIIDNTDGDEDDHDEETIMINQTFDLALRKINSVGNFVPGGEVTFTFEIYNQGTVDATNIVISDYIPTGLTLNDDDWVMMTNYNAKYTIVSLAAGDSTSVSISFDIQPNYQNILIENAGEISSANNVLGLPDIDSTPDTDPYNDVVVDDVIDNTGGDEDDYDIEQIIIELNFDLALRKTVLSGDLVPGGQVTFNIAVFNQANLNAYDILLTDYIPDGLILNDSTWTINGDNAQYTIPTLLGEDSTSVTITFDIAPDFTGGYIENAAEISNIANLLNMTDRDSSPDTINGNDVVIDDDISSLTDDEDDHDIAGILVTSTDNPLISDYEVTLAPNPAGRFFTVLVNDKGAAGLQKRLQLFNTEGRLIINRIFSANSQTISTVLLPQGMYFYQLKIEGQAVKMGKIIIQ